MELQQLELDTRNVETKNLGILARNIFVILAMEHKLEPTVDQSNKDILSHDWCRGLAYGVEMFCAARGMPVFFNDENVTRVARLLKLAYQDHNMNELVHKHKDEFERRFRG